MVFAPLFAAARSGRAVTIEVRHGNRRHSGAGGERPRRLEVPVAVAEQYRDGARPAVPDRQIRPAVAIEIPEHHERRTAVGREGPHRLERPVAVAEQHRHIVRPGVGGRQIRTSVGVEIAGGHGARTGARRQRHRRLEGAVTVARQHHDGVGRLVGDGQIRSPIPIEIRDRGRTRVVARPEEHDSWRLEASVRVAEQDRDAVAEAVRDGEILPQIAVDVANRDRCRTKAGGVVLVGGELERLRRNGCHPHREEQSCDNTQHEPGRRSSHVKIPRGERERDKWREREAPGQRAKSEGHWIVVLMSTDTVAEK